MSLTDALINPILATDPAGPRVTYYDDATGERVELSTITLMNWAAKTANLLTDEVALSPRSRIAVLLPAHWQTAAVLLGVWWTGAEAVLRHDEFAELVLTTPDRLDEVEGDAEIAVLSLDAFGRPVPDLPPGVLDYATSVRVHGDQYRPEQIEQEAPALAGQSIAQVLDAARESAARQEFTSDDRVLSTAGWKTPTELIDGLLAVLVAGASLVQVANQDEQRRDHRIATEKVTKQIG